MNTAITKNKTSAMRLIMLLLCLLILLTPMLSCAAMAEPIIIYEDPALFYDIEEDMSEVVTALPETGTNTQVPTKEPTELIWLCHALCFCFIYNWIATIGL